MDLAFSVCMLFEESVFIFPFLNNKMHNYVVIQTEKAKSSHFDRMRGDKKQKFPT